MCADVCDADNAGGHRQTAMMIRHRRMFLVCLRWIPHSSHFWRHSRYRKKHKWAHLWIPGIPKHLSLKRNAGVQLPLSKLWGQWIQQRMYSPPLCVVSFYTTESEHNTRIQCSPCVIAEWFYWLCEMHRQTLSSLILCLGEWALHVVMVPWRHDKSHLSRNQSVDVQGTCKMSTLGACAGMQICAVAALSVLLGD